MMERIPDEWIVQVRLFKFKTGGGLSFAEAMVNPTARILKMVIIRMKQEEIIITFLSFGKMAILAISHVMKSITYKHQIHRFRVFRQSLR
jgi:hypothetical protein